MRPVPGTHPFAVLYSLMGILQGTLAGVWDQARGVFPDFLFVAIAGQGERRECEQERRGAS